MYFVIGNLEGKLYPFFYSKTENGASEFFRRATHVATGSPRFWERKHREMRLVAEGELVGSGVGVCVSESPFGPKDVKKFFDEELKYVVFADRNTKEKRIVCFPKEFNHDYFRDVSQQLGEVTVSAGFCFILNEPHIRGKCFGKSETLRKESDPTDAELIK